MARTSEAQLRAIRKYDATRPKKPVSFRLDDDEMAELDRIRGGQSRADYMLGLFRKAAQRAKP